MQSMDTCSFSYGIDVNIFHALQHTKIIECSRYDLTLIDFEGIYVCDK